MMWKRAVLFSSPIIGAVTALAVQLANTPHALAQPNDDPLPGYRCLAFEGVDPSGQPVTTRVMVLSARRAWLEGKGFAPSSCRGALKWLRSTGPSLCALSDVNEPTFLAGFVAAHGLTPAELCTLSRELPNA